MSELENIKPLSSAKGFDRLVFDLADKKSFVRVCADGVGSLEGTMLSYDNNVLAIAVARDRFDFDVWDIPTSAIRAVALNKSAHPQT